MVATSIYENTYNTLLHNDALASGVELFTEIIEQMPDDVEGYIYRAQCHAHAAHIQAALADIHHALKITPNNGYAHYVHGNIHRQMLDINGAITAYTHAINNGYHAALNNRGVMLLRLKKYRAAYGDFTAVMEYDPTLVRAYHNRGLARFQLKDYYGAILDLEVAIAQNPDYVRSYLLLGTAYYMTGDHNKAQAALLYYDNHSNSDAAKSVLSRIDSNAETAEVTVITSLPDTEKLPTLPDLGIES